VIRLLEGGLRIKNRTSKLWRVKAKEQQMHKMCMAEAGNQQGELLSNGIWFEKPPFPWLRTTLRQEGAHGNRNKAAYGNAASQRAVVSDNIGG